MIRKLTRFIAVLALVISLVAIVISCFKSTIPPQNRTAFDDALLNAVLHGHLSTKTGRETLVTVTVPALIEKYQKS